MSATELLSSLSSLIYDEKFSPHRGGTVGVGGGKGSESMSGGKEGDEKGESAKEKTGENVISNES
jgi:hypothetical protein